MMTIFYRDKEYCASDGLQKALIIVGRKNIIIDVTFELRALKCERLEMSTGENPVQGRKPRQ